MITPVSFNSIKWKTYVVFAVINAFMVPCVYFFYPETAYRSLEEMDEIFHNVSGWKGAFTVVKVANSMPRRYGKKGELLIAYDDTEEAREVERRRSSVVSATAGGGGAKRGGSSDGNGEAELREKV